MKLDVADVIKDYVCVSPTQTRLLSADKFIGLSRGDTFTVVLFAQGMLTWRVCETVENVLYFDLIRDNVSDTRITVVKDRFEIFTFSGIIFVSNKDRLIVTESFTITVKYDNDGAIIAITPESSGQYNIKYCIIPHVSYHNITRNIANGIIRLTYDVLSSISAH
jgi:hypothetical protein